MFGKNLRSLASLLLPGLLAMIVVAGGVIAYQQYGANATAPTEPGVPQVPENVSGSVLKHVADRIATLEQTNKELKQTLSDVTAVLKQTEAQAKEQAEKDRAALTGLEQRLSTQGTATEQSLTNIQTAASSEVKQLADQLSRQTSKLGDDIRQVTASARSIISNGLTEIKKSQSETVSQVTKISTETAADLQLHHKRLADLERKAQPPQSDPPLAARIAALASTELNAGNRKEAKRLLREAFTIDPRDPAIPMLLGSILHAEGQVDLAEIFLSQGILLEKQAGELPEWWKNVRERLAVAYRNLIEDRRRLAPSNIPPLTLLR